MMYTLIIEAQPETAEGQIAGVRVAIDERWIHDRDVVQYTVEQAIQQLTGKYPT